MAQPNYIGSGIASQAASDEGARVRQARTERAARAKSEYDLAQAQAADQAIASAITEGAAPQRAQQTTVRTIRNPPAEVAERVRAAAQPGGGTTVQAEQAAVTPPQVTKPTGTPASAPKPKQPAFRGVQGLADTQMRIARKLAAAGQGTLAAAYLEKAEQRQEEVRKTAMQQVMDALKNGRPDQAKALSDQYQLGLPPEFFGDPRAQMTMVMAGEWGDAIYKDDPERRQQFVQVVSRVHDANPSWQPEEIISYALGQVPVRGTVKKTVEDAMVGGQPQIVHFDQFGNAIPATTAQGQPIGPEGMAPGAVELNLGDGRSIRIGGGQPSADWNKPRVNKLDNAIEQSSATLQRLNSIQAMYDPAFLTIPTQLEQMWNNFRDRLGPGWWQEGIDRVAGEMDPATQDQMRRYQVFRSSVFDNLSLYLNQLSGAAISEHEMARLKQSMPAMDDSPTQFKAKMDRVSFQMKLSLARLQLMRRYGPAATDYVNQEVGDVAQAFADLQFGTRRMLMNEGRRHAEGLMQRGEEPEDANLRALEFLEREYGIDITEDPEPI